MLSNALRAVFNRDQLTADDLGEQLHRPVRFLGNPFMDSVLRSGVAGAKGRFEHWWPCPAPTRN